jgi:signal transduction histidine kinase
MAASKPVPRRAFLAIATVFGVSSTLQSFGLAWLRQGEAMPGMLLHLLAANMLYWYVPALLAPGIMAFAERLRQRGVPWKRQALVHTAVALGFSVAHTATMAVTKVALMPDEPRPVWWKFFLGDYLWQLDWLVMTYLFIIGVSHALAYRRESEAAAVNGAQLETRLVQAQLQSLQRQLHPHFLFNTLNTISGLIHSDPNAADRMIDRLGDLLRMTLHVSGCQAVPLKEELELLQKYVDIEQTRFGDRLTVDMHIDPETLDAQVPQLLLQPLVENAIRHGVAPNSRPGWISIHASRRGDDLTIEVRDSGNGLPPERLVALNRGVGLDNTRARLEHMYRSRFRFVFTNLKDGFCVTVGIPFQDGPLEDQTEQVSTSAA